MSSYAVTIRTSKNPDKGVGDLDDNEANTNAWCPHIPRQLASCRHSSLFKPFQYSVYTLLFCLRWRGFVISKWNWYNRIHWRKSGLLIEYVFFFVVVVFLFLKYSLLPCPENKWLLLSSPLMVLGHYYYYYVESSVLYKP